jgi:hypothetical protein
MKRSHTLLALLAIGLLASCGTTLPPKPLTEVGTLQKEFEDLLAKLPADRSGVQPQLAQLAQRAQIAAQSEETPQNKVALYRIAALAAWQAGPAGGDQVSVIATEGASACNALPPAQQRPTDCAVIALAKPFAIADSLRLRLLALVDDLNRLDTAHAATCNALAGAPQQDCLAEAVKLPATDRPEVMQLFSGFETEFTEARLVAHGMGNVGAGLADAAKNGQTILYCEAEKTWLLAKRVDGMQSDRDALTCRRKRLDCLLTHSDADCADPCPSDEGNPVVDCQGLAQEPLTLPVQ